MKATTLAILIGIISFACSTEQKEKATSTESSTTASAEENKSSNTTSETSTSDASENSSSAPSNTEPVEAEEFTLPNNVRIGISVDELKKLYPKAVFKKLPSDGYGNTVKEQGLLVVENKEPLFYVVHAKGKKNIAGLTLLTPGIRIEEGVHVGITYEQFMKKYPESELTIDVYENNMECIYVPEKRYRVEFATSDSNRVGNYDMTGPAPEFKNVARPKTKIARISAY
jgi:hypothetical protein